MGNAGISVVTGASGYTGKYIARLLLGRGDRVVNLTGHPERPHEFGDKVRNVSLQFDRPEELARSLKGATVLYNTYWVRFPYRDVTYATAVNNSRTLFDAARKAGVRRIVHVSICNPSEDSSLGYYKGKAEVEIALRDSGVSHAILRPTVIFGKEDILINNIAWMLRRFPVFAVPGDGEYRIQPIFVEDMARLAVEAADKTDNIVLDAVGPEIFAFNDLVRLIAIKIGRKPRLVHAPDAVVFLLTSLLGPFVGDTLLTWEEIKGLVSGLLASSRLATGPTRFSRWLEENAANVGLRYSSELARHF
jgi:NADH dehydrogenase